MGKGDKKKFIGKDEGTKFYVLHRSQTDTAYAQEAEPSKYVLFPAQGSASSAAATSASLGSAVQLQLTSQKDHINSLGFKNDGYDYSKHLKEMGGGKFIGRDSKVVDMPMPEGHYTSSSSSSSAATVGGLTLPEEALAGGEKGRDLTAITISQECMDDDLKAALWEDEDEDGAFETLDDDFVAQVMQEPETKDFDFEAHIARLIAQSEEKTVAARPWGDEAAGSSSSSSNSKAAAKGSKAKPRADRKAAAFSAAAADAAGGDEDEDEDDAEWEDEDEEEEGEGDDDSGYFDADAALEDDDEDDQEYSSDEDSEGGERTGRGGGGTDEHFERVLDEYAEDAIGGLSDEEEDDIGGMLEADDDKLSAAIEEFLRDAKDQQLAEGVAKPAKGLRSIPNLEKYIGKEAAEEEGEMTAERLKAAVAEQEELQQEMYEYIESYNRKQRSARHRNGAAAHDNNGSAHNKSKTHSSGLEHGEATGMGADVESHDETGKVTKGVEVDEDDDAFLLSCQEYLRELKVEEEWDCETILSTYSVLDNHPTVIAAEPSTRRKKSSRKGGAGSDGASSVGGYSGIGGSAYSNSMSHRSGKWGADPNPQQMEFRSKFNEMVRRHNEGLRGQTDAGAGAGAGAGASANGSAAPKVQFVLKGKHSLPEVQPLAPISDSSSGRSSVQDYVNGLLMTERRKKQMKNGRGHKPRAVGNGLAIPDSIPEHEDEAEGSDDEDEEEEEEEEGEGEGEEERQRGEKVPRRRRNETKEEKKARKQAAKALKTERKQVKKQNKLSFKGEEQRMVAAAAKGQEINNISVFKYSH